MTIKLIFAIDKNYSIGYKDNLLFHIPEDLKRFRQYTEGHVIVMGRKTYESLPSALPNRLNVVLTKNKSYKPKESSTIIQHNINQIITYYTKSGLQHKDLWIIGGSEILDEFLPYADEIHLTKIHLEAENVDTWLSKKMIQAIEKDWIFYSTENIYSEKAKCYLEFNVYKRDVNE